MQTSLRESLYKPSFAESWNGKSENIHTLIIYFYCHVYISKLWFMIIYGSYAYPVEKGLNSLGIV